MTAPRAACAWWERQDPTTFLAFNWDHPSRAIATGAAMELLEERTAHELLEVGPGSGIDYAVHFAEAVRAGLMTYTGWEPTAAFHGSLQLRFPGVAWRNASLYDLPAAVADVVYARAVLEHQATLEPALSCLLAAARTGVVIDWYRPPAAVATHDVHEGVDCWTYARHEVAGSIAAAGFLHARPPVAVAGNEVWVLRRVT